jgi:hypothetical protein
MGSEARCWWRVPRQPAGAARDYHAQHKDRTRLAAVEDDAARAPRCDVDARLSSVAHARGLPVAAEGTIAAGHFSDADLPAWWGARHAKRMYNATTSSNTPYADPQGGFTILDPQQQRLHRDARAQGYADLYNTCWHAPSSRSAPRSWPASLAPPPWLSATCWTPQASPRHPAK